MPTLLVFHGVPIFDAAQIVGEVTVDPATGYLTAPVNATRAGVFEYRDEMGRVVRVLRPEEEVFKAESMATLARKPATYNHPENLPTAADIKKYTVGATGDVVTKVANFVRTSVTVFDQGAINSIKGGNHEVSCGYTATVFKEGGVHHEFGPYDMVQRNMVYNHLAVGIPKGRGGPDVRMLLDSADPQENPMKKIKIGDKEYEVPEDLADALTREKAAMDAKLEAAAVKDGGKGKPKKAKGKKDDDDDDDDDGEEEEAMDMADLVNAVTSESEARQTALMDALQMRTLGGRLLKGAFNRLQGRVVAATEAAKQQIADSAVTTPAKLAQAAASHAKLVAVAMAVMDKADPNELFQKPSLEIKKLIILAKMPNTKFEGKPSEFVDGLYEGVALGVAPSNIGEVLGAILSDKGLEGQRQPGGEVRAPYFDAAGFGARQAARKPWEKKPLLHTSRQAAAA